MAQFSTEQINALISEYPNEFTMTWAGGEAKVKKFVTLRQIIDIVRLTTSLCFDEDGEYMPEVKDFVMWSNIVDNYTDIELPEDIEVCAEVLIKTNLIETIKEYVSIEQIVAIQDAIDARIAIVIDAGNNVLMKQVLQSVTDMASMQEALEGALATFDGINPVELRKFVEQKVEEAK